MSNGTTPEDRTTWVSNFCSWGPRPLIMDGIFCELLKQHFGNADNFEHEQLTGRIYNALAESNKILIETPTTWTPQQTQRRLALIVKRNDWKSIKRGTLGNVSGNTSEGFKQHTKYWRGSHTLFAIAKEGPEAQILAAEVYRYFNHFGPWFREFFSLMMFELVGVGTLSRIAEQDTHWGIPITIAYGWADEWTLKTDAPTLAAINMSDIFRIWP